MLAVGLLAGVVGGYIWKKKNVRKGKMYVVTQIHDFFFVYFLTLSSQGLDLLFVVAAALHKLHRKVWLWSI